MSAIIDETKHTTYRFKFNKNTIDALNKFSTTNYVDDKQAYREQWKRWCNNNADIITKETERLQSLGYTGDVTDKMYKSVRYYFSKKAGKSIEPKQRRKYVSMDSDILDAMDKHVTVNINEPHYSQSWGYIDFCKTHVALLQDEICRLKREDRLVAKDIIQKIKKTYKNRYFQITN